MTKKIALGLCILMILPFATGCMDSLKFWNKKKEVELVNKKLPPFEVLFNRTMELYNNKQYKKAIDSFLFLRENYPSNTTYQSRITLYLADSHYKLKEYPEALVSYKDFIKFYPRNPDIPYAWFQIGMSNYKQRRTYDRDASFTRKGMAAFKKVLQVSAPGVLTNESIRMIAYCQRDLALHEMFVADFYYRTHHYKSAILRYSSILTTYKNIKVADRAHLGIARAYLKLKEKDKALPHLGFVARYYPLTPSGKTAWKILGGTYHITSRGQLPDTSLFAKQSSEKLPPKSLVCPPPKKAAPAKKIKTVPTPAPVSSTKKLKPHVYLPKITKTEKKQTAYLPPVKKGKEQAIPSQPVVQKPLVTGKSKPVKTSIPAKKSTEAVKSSSAFSAPSPEKTPELIVQKKKAPPTQKKQPVKKVAKSKPAKPVPAKTTSVKPVLKKEAQKSPSAEVSGKGLKQKAAAPAVKKTTMKPAPKKHLKKPVVKKVAKNDSSSPPPKVITKKISKKARVKVPSSEKKVAPVATPPHVKKMVKTDTLPPAKKKKAKAPSDVSGLVGAMDTRLPINITSDHVIAKQGKNYVKFKGNVIAKQKNVTLSCENLTAYYAKGGKAIDRIIAEKNVIITQLNKKVRCGKATFYNAKRKIILEHAPRAWDGNNRISGDKMILLLEKNEIRILGSSRKPTELVIYPDKKP